MSQRTIEISPDLDKVSAFSGHLCQIDVNPWLKNNSIGKHDMSDSRKRKPTASAKLQIRDNLLSSYSDVYAPEIMTALASLAGFNEDQKEVMAGRIKRRAERARNKQRIDFLDANDTIPRTGIKVQDARDGKFVGSEIPTDLQRQWIQGTGPGAKHHDTRSPQ